MKAASGQIGRFACSSGRIEPYEVRVSTRASRARVTYNASDGLVVVVPARSSADPAALLERFRPEVERMIVRMKPMRDAYLRSEQAPLPDVLDLRGIGEKWQVEYRATDAEGASARIAGRKPADGGGTLVVSGVAVKEAMGPGSEQGREACEKALRAFVVRRAKEALPELLSATAPELGLTFSKCRVTPAHTRWGSCNRSKVIMLSAQLACLPPELVYHIMCHELAHTVHLDHSAKFHALLNRLDPDAAKHERQMRQASSYVPHWMS